MSKLEALVETGSCGKETCPTVSRQLKLSVTSLTTCTSYTAQIGMYLPNVGLAAAKTEVRDLIIVEMPALAIEMVCCSIA